MKQNSLAKFVSNSRLKIENVVAYNKKCVGADSRDWKLCSS